jgi:hypothetical protein
MSKVIGPAREVPTAAQDIVEAFERRLPQLIDRMARELAGALLREDQLRAFLVAAATKTLLQGQPGRATIDDASEVRRAEAEGEDVWRDHERERSASSDHTHMELDGVSSSSMQKAIELISRAKAKRKPGK